MAVAEPKVVFFGTGPVAAESLKLLAKHTDIEAVVTKPKPPHHRGKTPVVDLAEKMNIPLITAASKKELTAVIEAQQFTSQVAVLIDFGIIVEQAVIDTFPLGIVNSHFSVLPELRGADPISFAILSGQETTGVSLMLLVEKMDEGPLIAYGEHALSGQETTSELTAELIGLSDGLLKEMLPQYIKEPQTMAQSVTGRSVSYSRKLTKADGLLDWSKPAEQLEREVRAYHDWPKSYTVLGGKEVVITQSSVSKMKLESGAPHAEGHQLFIGCGLGSLEIIKIKPAGKAEMSAQAFLAGHKNKLAN